MKRRSWVEVIPALAASLFAVAVARAAHPDQLNPCGPDPRHYWAAEIAQVGPPNPAQTVVAMYAMPSANTNWSVGIIHSQGRSYTLRVAMWDNGAYHTDWRTSLSPNLQAVPAMHGKTNIGDQEGSREHAESVEVVLPADIATSLRRLVTIATVRAVPNKIIGLDGVNYRFDAGDMSPACTWSPSSNSRPGKLVTIFARLRDLALDPNPVNRRNREAIIRAELRGLEKK